jgi:hypothetical protein
MHNCTRLYKREDVVQFTRGIRIEWVDHVWWADRSYVDRSIDIYGERKGSRGRPQKRLKDSVKELLEKIGADWEQAYD